MPSEPIKIMQLNIWQGRLLRQVVELISREKPDILCLQEVYSSQLNIPQFDFFNSFEQIQVALPNYKGFLSPNFEFKNILGRTVGYGNAIFSRFDFIDQTNIFTSGQFISYENIADYRSNQLGLQRVKIKIDGEKSLTVFNHHGYWDRDPHGNSNSLLAMQAVANEIKKQTGPIILAGDLNLIPGSPALAPLNEQLKGLTETYNLPTTLSGFGKVSGVACDHIFISSDVNVVRFESINAEVSDHLPLIMEFNI